MHARYLAGCRERTQDGREIDSARLAKLADHVPNIAQQQPGDRMGFADMLGRAAVHTTRGDIELEAQGRQMMPERIVEVARNTEPLPNPAVLRQ